MGDDTDKLLPRYSKEEVAERAFFLFERCEVYLSEVQRVLPSSRFSFDPLVILNIAQSTLDDIWRYKVFHLPDPEKLSDAVKRAAYMTKWIVRLRPIYFNRLLSDGIPSAPLDESDPTFAINEGFAIQRGLDTIATEIGVKEIHIDPEFRANLIYDLHYREISDDALLMMYEVLRNEMLGKPFVIKTF